MSRGAIGLIAPVPWRPVTLMAGGGLTLLCVASIWVTSPGASNALKIGIAAIAAGAAYVLDESATEAVAATPTSLRSRTLARLACAAVVLGVGSVGLTAFLLRSDGLDRAGLLAQLVGCLLATLAAAAVMRRRVAEPGELVAGAVLGLVVILGFMNPLARWFDVFPTEPGQRWGGSLVVWATAALIAVVALAHATRDPLD